MQLELLLMKISLIQIAKPWEKKLKDAWFLKAILKGKKTGYYFIKHDNHFDGKSFNYEVAPVKVILDDTNSKGNINSLGLYYWLLLILIMI